MALVVADRVQETSTTAGTGTLSLSGAVAGNQTFASGVGVGNTTYYALYDQTAQVWEVGLGTVGSGTLARTTVLANSSGTTSPLNLAGNSVVVWCDYPAEKAVYKDASGNVTLGGALNVTGTTTLATSLTGILKAASGVVSTAVSGTDYAPATSGTSILKGNGAGGFSSAVSGTDYAPATSGSAILYGNGSGGFSSVTIGSGVSFVGGTLSATGTGGTVTAVSVVSANGLAGTVANPTTTPAITLSTSVSGILKGNGTGISAAVAGTDYVPTSGTGATGTWGISISGNAATATTTDNIDGIAFKNADSSSSFVVDTQGTNGIGYSTGYTLFGQADGGVYCSTYNASWQHQINGDFRTGQIAIRGKNSGTWQSWRTVLDSGNYTSYSPSLTGTGASGTWGISISGNAATVSGFKNIGSIAVQAVAGSNQSCTTAQFVSWYSSNYSFLSYTYTVAKCTWDYAGNNEISDTSIGSCEMAGCTIETFADGTYYTIRITRPTTGTGGAQELIYNNQGSGYSPGWRTELNNLNYSSYSNFGTNAVYGGIYYDGSNTAYYVDPASTSNLYYLNFQSVPTVNGYSPANGVIRLTPNLHLNSTAGYAVILNWDNGTTGATLNFRVGNGAGSDIFYTRADGYGYISGYLEGGGSLRAPIFYDSNNTAYYLDPNAGSRLNETYTTQSYTYGWFRNYGAQGLYNQDYGNHWYSDGNFWNVAYNGSTGIRLRMTGHAGSTAGYYYGDTSLNSGLLNNSGSWKVRVNGSDTEIYDYLYWNDGRGYIFYDRNDTTYYVDPNSTSLLYRLNVNGSSVAQSGYTRLVNGVILQWGRIAGITSNDGTATITFPVAFPTLCCAAVTGHQESGTSSNPTSTTCIIGTPSTTGMTIAQDTYATGSQYEYWIAIGY